MAAADEALPIQRKATYDKDRNRMGDHVVYSRSPHADELMTHVFFSVQADYTSGSRGLFCPI